jgi:alkylation response protein AidB-like acyl-CoA dehydrogenase
MCNFAMLRDELLAEVETIAPVVREYASQSEQLGRLADPIIKAARQTSLLRFICAHELGGSEADPLTVMEVSEALSRIDGSVGWTLGIIANATALAGAFLPAESARRVFCSGVPIIVGALQPRNGTAEPVDSGYLVNGRWSFGSGIHFADWVLAGALVPDQSPPAGLRVTVLPREQVTVHDNWQVAGLRGTGSCDFSIDNVFVPDNMTFSIWTQSTAMSLPARR